MTSTHVVRIAVDSRRSRRLVESVGWVDRVSTTNSTHQYFSAHRGSQSVRRASRAKRSRTASHCRSRRPDYRNRQDPRVTSTAGLLVGRRRSGGFFRMPGRRSRWMMGAGLTRSPSQPWQPRRPVVQQVRARMTRPALERFRSLSAELRADCALRDPRSRPHPGGWRADSYPESQASGVLQIQRCHRFPPHMSWSPSVRRSRFAMGRGFAYGKGTTPIESCCSAALSASAPSPTTGASWCR